MEEWYLTSEKVMLSKAKITRRIPAVIERKLNKWILKKSIKKLPRRNFKMNAPMYESVIESVIDSRYIQPSDIQKNPLYSFRMRKEFKIYVIHG